MTERAVTGDIEQRLDRIDLALRILVRWLVQAQTGFGERDARGIEEILDGKRHYANEDR